MAKLVVSRLSACSASRCSRSHCGSCAMIASSSLWICSMLARVRGKGVEQVGGQHLAIAPRRQTETHRRADQGHALGFGPLLQSGEGVVALLLELLVERAAPDPVFVALESRGQGRA